MKQPFFAFTFFLLSFTIMAAYERAFEPTEVGTIEVKTLPAAKLIASHTDGEYFDDNNGLFMPLFRYIDSRDIAMTTPVEAEINPGVMYFYIGRDAANRELDSTNNVSVLELPERTVVSIGMRGGYSQARFNKGSELLQTWLADNSEWKANGEARAIYWNGPYTPAIVKRSEVHIPVEKIADTES